MTVLYSPEAPELKLGNEEEADIIVFRDGFAEVALDDPARAIKMAWVARTNEVRIEVLGEQTDVALPGTGFACEICGNEFKSDKSRQGHILGAHRKKA